MRNIETIIDGLRESSLVVLDDYEFKDPSKDLHEKAQTIRLFVEMFSGLERIHSGKSDDDEMTHDNYVLDYLRRHTKFFQISDPNFYIGLMAKIVHGQADSYPSLSESRVTAVEIDGLISGFQGFVAEFKKILNVGDGNDASKEKLVAAVEQVEAHYSSMVPVWKNALHRINGAQPHGAVSGPQFD